jgi:hypothetical protein
MPLYIIFIMDIALYNRKGSKMPSIRKVLMFLACAAAFVSAQFSWESDANYDSNYGSDTSSEPPPTSGSDGDQSFNTAEEPAFESYDIGPYSSDKGKDGSKKSSADKPPKEKKQKTARGKPSFSFSSAFSGPQKTCPVCASVRLKNNQYVDYSGGRIHACSAACTPRVRRNPAPFAEILFKRGEQLASPE